MRSGGIRPRRAILPDLQPHARAPARSIGRPAVRRGQSRGLNHDIRVDAGHPGQRLGEHLPLQFTLMGKFDVAELGSAGPIFGGAVHRGGLPHVWLAVRAMRCSTETVSARQNAFLESSVITPLPFRPGSRR